MFGSLGVPEILLIFAVALIVFGPRRLPEIGRTLGKALGEFRKATDELKSTIEREVRMEELKQITPMVTPFESVSRTEPVAPAATVASMEPPAASIEPAPMPAPVPAELPTATQAEPTIVDSTPKADG